MSYTMDNNREERMLQGSNGHPALKRFVHRVWNILVSFIMDARDVLGSGRIQL